MPGKFEAPRKKHRILPILFSGVLVIAAAAFLLLSPERELPPDPGPTLPPTTSAPETEATTLPPETEPLIQVVATASIASQGDLLMHKPIMDVCRLEDGSWDFSSVFQYMTDYTSRWDYCVANLETTFGGDDFVYQGWPLFNCPDSFAPAVADAGYDMLLTANNHSYDTLMTGITRTLEQVEQAGLASLGTRLTEDTPRYRVVDINGIQLGLVCYTFTTSMKEGKPRLNGNAPVEQPELVNYFSQANLDGFCGELEPVLAEMEAAGAEASVVYIHWGNEYEIKENSTQNAIAQRLCDLGVDVIIGGHPHVVQPMELLESTRDPDHKTVCIYSLGNAVSNQRREKMNLNTGHTEDGALFHISFEKYSDGAVYLADADVLPTWVNLSDVNGQMEYNILPLDIRQKDQWQQLFSLTDPLYEKALASYDRTVAIIGEGLEECRSYLAEQKQLREEHYMTIWQNQE